MYRCTECGRTYNAKVLDRCPVCALPRLKADDREETVEAAPVKSSPQADKRVERSAWSSKKSHYASITKEQAKIVNGYGTVIQVLGIILGVIVLIATVIRFNNTQQTFLGVIVGLVLGGIVVISSIIAGAIYRMVSNYFMFKVEN